MSVHIRIYSDFTCPYCFLATGLMEQLKVEFDIQEEWVSYELHPETPQDGILLADRFPDYDFESLFEELRIKGERYGYAFGDVSILSNSRKALETSEFARDHGRYHAFHDAAFRAYFSEARDIGQLPVLLDVAVKAGLDGGELQEALTDRRYAARLRRGREEAEACAVSVLPTFVFNGRDKLVGLRPVEAFRQVIKGLSYQPL